MTKTIQVGEKIKNIRELRNITREELGELCCRGYNVMKGYYKNAEETAEAIDQ